MLADDPEGQAATFNTDERRGLRLFIGEGNCMQCHNGPLLSDGKFYRLGVSYNDQGRAKITHKKEDRYRFRTPTLRNIGTARTAARCVSR